MCKCQLVDFLLVTVILYTVALGVIVAAVLVTAKDLETSLTEKQNILTDLTEQHNQLKLNLDESLSEARETEVRFRKTQDELEVCNKNYQHDVANLRQEITDTKTKLFDSLSQVNELSALNTELSGQLMIIERKSDELTTQNEKLSREKTALNSVITDLNQNKNDFEYEVLHLKASIEEKEKSFESSQVQHREELDNLKGSYLSQVEALKAAQVESLAALQLEINSQQDLTKSRDEQILLLQNNLSEQDILLKETNKRLTETELSLKDKTEVYEDLKQTLTAKQDQFDVKENELQKCKSFYQEEVDLLNKRLADHEKYSEDTTKINEALKQTIAGKDDELKLKDSEKELSLRKIEQKIVDLRKLLTEQENINGELILEEKNMKTKIDELVGELEKTRKDAGECLVKKNEEEVLLMEQMDSLRLERDSAEQKLKEIDLKILSECKTN